MSPVIARPSAHGYEATMKSLLEAIAGRGLTVFARVDHAGGAREVGLELADEEVVLFGNARAGTPLMQSDPRIGIELPLRMLVWRQGDQVLLGYLDPRDLSGRYDVAENASTLAQMAKLLEGLAGEAAGA